LLSWDIWAYVPGPGFLFLIVSINGPVTSIYVLPYPNPKPFLAFFEKWSFRLYVLGGGEWGDYFVKSYLWPKPKVVVLDGLIEAES
jgi:hypothetical protein